MIDRIFRNLLLISFLGEGLSIDANETWVPFVVSLENDGGKFCAGSVVGTKWIVTIASCVRDKQPNEFAVQIPSRDMVTGYHAKVEKVLIYPEHRPSIVSLEFNVALVKLRRPIVFEYYTSSIDVTQYPLYPENVLQCLLVDTLDGSLLGGAQVQHIQLRPSKTCSKESKYKICAVNFEDHLCRFHRGSPLICQHGSNFLLTGLLSGSVQCFRQNVSDVLLSINMFEAWINGVISGNEVNPEGSNSTNYSMKLSQFNWMIVAVSFFILSATIFIMVLRSGFKAR